MCLLVSFSFMCITHLTSVKTPGYPDFSGQGGVGNQILILTEHAEKLTDFSRVRGLCRMVAELRKCIASKLDNFWPICFL